MNDGRISLTFICVDCGSALVIRAPKERGLFPGRYPWRCFDCQGSWPSGKTGTVGKVGKGTEPSRREEE